MTDPARPGQPGDRRREGDLPVRVDAVVVGAGMAGLAAARALRRSGRDVVVLESTERVGGRVGSGLVGGYRLDRGFQVVLTAYPELRRQLDVPALDLRCFDPGALVWLGRRMHRLGDPTRVPSTILDSALAPIGTPLDKIRLARLLRRLRLTDARELLTGDDVTSLEALRHDGFSDAMIARLFSPLVGGIQLDLGLTASRRMLDVVLRCLAVGDSAVPAGGMQALPEQMAAGLPPRTIVTGAPVVALDARSVRLATGEEIAARCVVVATDGPAASALLGLPAVGSRPATCVWFAAPRAPVRDRLVVLDGTGRGPAANVAVLTNVAPSYSPDTTAVVAAACPGSFDPGVEPAVRAQLRTWWGPTVDSWRHLRTDTVAHGQPDQAPPFHPKRTVALANGIFVCGDHRDTASIQGALFSGRRCGEAAAARTA